MQRRQFVLLTALGAVGCDVESEPKVPTSTGEIDSDEADGLVFMRQEEKLARDVYMQLGEVHPMRVFDNISAAEQRHMDAVGNLLDRYGIEDPVEDLPVGALVNEDLQKLHDELVARGLQSQEEAFRVGALIEEVDILDLRERSAQTDEAAIQEVYANLESGSHNHLRAFVRQLDRIGIEYVPQQLAPEDYTEIVGQITASRGRSRGAGGPPWRGARHRRGRRRGTSRPDRRR